MTGPHRPDTSARIWIATIVLILVLSYLTGAHGIWTGQPFPMVSR